MPPEEPSLKSTPLNAIQDLGPFPLILAAVFALCIVILFLVGVAKRNRPDTTDRCLLLLFVLTGLAFLTGSILSSSHAAILHELQSRAGVDPQMLSYDHFLMEWERLLFYFVSVFALLASGLLVLFKKSVTTQHPD